MKSNLSVVFILLALGGCGNGAMQSNAADPPSYIPNAIAGVQTGMPFDYQSSPAQEEMNGVNLVWGSCWPDNGDGITRLAYVQFEVADVYAFPAGIPAGECQETLANVPLSWFQANHPDWIEYQCDRKTIAYEFGQHHVPLNTSNPAVIQWQYQTEVAPAIARGYDGIAWDNLNLINAFQRCGHYNSAGAWVQQYTGSYPDAAYENDVLNWAISMAALVHEDHALFSINFSIETPVPSESDLDVQLMEMADVVFDERGFTNGGSGPLTGSAWTEDFNDLTAVMAHGTCVYSSNAGPADPALGTFDGSGLGIGIPQQWGTYAIANYLLMKGPCMYYSEQGFQQYGQYLDSPNYHLNIGTPTDAATENADGSWTRTFTHGSVTVNPNTASATITETP